MDNNELNKNFEECVSCNDKDTCEEVLADGDI